jgi:NAD(P)H-flavin reductase
LTHGSVSDAKIIAGVAPRVATVRRVVEAASETYTYWVSLDDPEERRTYRFLPGQINMIGIPGIGEVPISMSSDPGLPMRLGHTIRSCGRVTDAFRALEVGDRVTVRGPFGKPWPLEQARGGDLMLIAGGLGLAPLRPAIYSALHDRDAFRRVAILVGARGPDHMLFREELYAWHELMAFRGVEVYYTVDIADDAWPYSEGLVTALFPSVDLNPGSTSAMICGPEIMMRFAAYDLIERGIPDQRIWVSMERNMQCGVRLCGHCQLGPYFVCADGPVFRWDQIGEFFSVEEL